MKSLLSKSEFKYHSFCHDLDVDAFEAAIGFEPSRQATNKHGEDEDVGQCPDPWGLHKNGDTTGKFAINRDKRLYNCFVCEGGTLLDLAMALNDQTEQEAETWLYQFARPVEQTDHDFLSEIDAILAEERRAEPVMPYYNARVLGQWEENLPQIEGWLKERGISDGVAQEAHLGYAPDARRLPPHNKPQEPYSGPCVYFPHFWGERLVGWQQRWLSEDRPKWIPKYTNTTGFPKTETIYNYERCYLAERPIVVCESVPTVLFLWSLGYPAVALFGASVTDEQVRLLRLFQQGVVLAPDNDAPGRKWVEYTESEQRARARGKTVDRVILAEELARFVPVRVMEPVGEYDSGNDIGDLLSEGTRFAAAALGVLYHEAELYY